MRKLSTLFVLCLAPVPAFAQFMRGKVVMPDGSAPAQKAFITWNAAKHPFKAQLDSG